MWTVQRMRARQAQTLFVLGHAVHPLCHGRASFHALYDPTLNNSTLLKLGAGHITLGGLSVPANLEHQAKLWTPHAAKITRPSDEWTCQIRGAQVVRPDLIVVSTTSQGTSGDEARLAALPVHALVKSQSVQRADRSPPRGPAPGSRAHSGRRRHWRSRRWPHRRHRCCPGRRRWRSGHPSGSGRGRG